MRAHLRPPLFLITGFGWLMASAALGVLLWLGMVLGWSLPHGLRLVHVHGALVGGVAQIILGALLSFIPTLLMTGKDRAESHPLLYLLINAGALLLITGFWLKHSILIAAAGSLILLAFLTVFSDAIGQARASLNAPPLNLLFYGLALVALLGGIGMGLAMAMSWLPPTLQGQGRLAHIHLNLLGFVTLTIVGTMHNLFPTVLNAPLYSPALARITFVAMPLGILGLIAGFAFSRLWIEIGSGVVLLGGALAYAVNMLRTWLNAGRPRRVSADHFMLATLFLILAIATGIGVAVNALWDPPALAFGQLHLVAYTHLALIGFIFQTIVGALSHLLPVVLALARVPSNKKRAPYLATLHAIVEQWRSLQIGAFSLGTIGLLLVAGLVWQFSLNSTPVRVATWASGLLLTAGLLTVAVKIGRLLLTQPSSDSHHQSHE
jgi:hypothetical protein